MINFIFTIDYEIYGDGSGQLHDLVLEPARRLTDLFRKWNARYVAFVEAAELEKIDASGTDSAIDQVKKQIAEFHRDGFEVALHLHPQWANAEFRNHAWELDDREYNLCTLSRTRIAEIVDSGLNYLRYAANTSQLRPLAFRAGNWLFQPTATAANVLSERGLRIDSSVFKGGVQRNRELDYRPALQNDGYFWRFERDVNQSDPHGPWLEVPIYTEMVAFWKMATPKRLGMKSGNAAGARSHNLSQSVGRLRDRMRLFYPLKLDFCRMTQDELITMMGRIIDEDRKDPETLRPVVAIGHTKDLEDFATVEALLMFLRDMQVPISTFEDIYPALAKAASMTISNTCSAPEPDVVHQGQA